MNEKGKLETWITSEKISYGLEHALKNPRILFSAFWLRSIVEEPTDTLLGLLAKIKCCWRTHGYHLMEWQFTLHSWYGRFCISSHFVQMQPQPLTSTQELHLSCCSSVVARGKALPSGHHSLDLGALHPQFPGDCIMPWHSGPSTII